VSPAEESAESDGEDEQDDDDEHDVPPKKGKVQDVSTDAVCYAMVDLAICLCM
jgi:hypothetical protein